MPCSAVFVPQIATNAHVHKKKNVLFDHATLAAHLREEPQNTLFPVYKDP